MAPNALIAAAAETVAPAASNGAAETAETLTTSPIVALEVALLFMLIIVAYVMLKSRHLFAVVMLSGIYSLLTASFFVALDAVDVAFTEAAVGAGISTVLMLAGMLLTARREKPATPGRAPVALVTVILTGAALVYATIDMPAFGDRYSPANAGVGQTYVERTPKDIDVPNIVTAVLASYRGFDTLGETTVVFTAGLAVMLLLGVGAARGGRAVADRPPDGDDAETEAGAQREGDAGGR